MPPRLVAPALLLLVSVLWSLGGVLIKSVDWPPMAIAGARSAIALPVIVACAGWPRVTFSRAQLGGGVAYAAMVIFFVLATRLTTAANAIFLQYTAPLYVAALGHWLLGERALKSDWALIAVALAGIALFFVDGLTLEGMWGNVCGLASGLAFAATALLLRKQRAESPLAAILLGNVLAALAGLPFLAGAHVLPARGWIALALLGSVQLGLSYVLYSVAIQRVTAIEAVLIPLLEPVLNPLWVMLLVGERPGAWALAGAALVIGAVFLRGTLMVLSRR